LPNVRSRKCGKQGLDGSSPETVETVSWSNIGWNTRLKPGVNRKRIRLNPSVIEKTMNLLTATFLSILVVGSVSPTIAQQSERDDATQGDVSPSREILLKRFTESRPAAAQSKPAPHSRRRVPLVATARKSKYRRAPVEQPGTRPNSIQAGLTAAAEPAEVGVTIWRLRPSDASDHGARKIGLEGSKQVEFTPERVEVGTPLQVNDRVFLSVESPRAGYLYVVDREQYADGSMGDAVLIFPTTRTNGGDNRVTPGKLIDIPAQNDDPSYFTLVPSPSRQDQVAEILSIVVTTAPLGNFPISDKPLTLGKSQIAKWEKEWCSGVERYELEGGAGQQWSQEEKEASAGVNGRYLRQGDPSPQTIYLVEAKNNVGLLVTIPLRYRR
jgi:hypothetical protein